MDLSEKALRPTRLSVSAVFAIVSPAVASPETLSSFEG